MTTEQQLHYLQAMGIPLWQLKKNATHSNPADQTEWEVLQRTVVNCTACGLHKNRTQTVFGVGNRQAKLMLIGEAPGFYEDKQGEPFVGRAGQLLNAMLEAIGLSRHEVYIANILKCRPPDNRDPSSEEVKLCTPFLTKQIALVQPKLLLAVGRIAAHFLLNTTLSTERLRQTVHTYQPFQIPLIVTYHPAYLLRQPKQKSKAWQDLQRVSQMI